MNRLMWAFAMAGLLSSCGVLKRQSKNEHERSYTSTEVSRSEEKDSAKEKKVLVTRDSLQEEFVVEIVPSGMFTFSPADGFKGAATAIKMKGRKQGITKSLEKTELATSHQRSQQAVAAKKERETESKSEGFRFGIDFSFYMIIAIVVALLCVWWRYKARFGS